MCACKFTVAILFALKKVRGMGQNVGAKKKLTYVVLFVVVDVG